MFEISYSEYNIIERAVQQLCLSNFKDSHIDIYMDDGAFTDNTIIVATINWPSIGSVSADMAEDFANDMLSAVEIAKTINMMQFTISKWDYDDMSYRKILAQKKNEIISALMNCDEFELESIINDTRDEYGY